MVICLGLCKYLLVGLLISFQGFFSILGKPAKVSLGINADHTNIWMQLQFFKPYYQPIKYLLKAHPGLVWLQRAFPNSVINYAMSLKFFLSRSWLS